MSVDLSITMTAAVPRPDFTSRRLSKSISTSSQMSFGSNGTEEPPGMTAFQIVPAAAHAAGMFLDQLLQRDATSLLRHCTACSRGRRCRTAWCPYCSRARSLEPLRAAPQDRRYDRDRLNIVHRGRAAIKPAIRRERRLQARLALLAFQAFQQRGFFAADIGAGAAVDVNVEIIARAAGVLADQPGFIGLVDRRLQRLAS